jgi:hypothetical protein
VRYIIILLLSSNPIYIPFDTTVSCIDQGEEIIESIATYHGPGTDQGWYTEDNKLIYGFYCE